MPLKRVKCFHRLLHSANPRAFATSASILRMKTSNLEPELTMSSARHKPRLSSMSFGLLISELNSNNLTEAAQSFRDQAGSIPDSERTILRRVGYWVLGVPVVVGVVGSGVILDARRRRRNKAEMEDSVE